MRTITAIEELASAIEFLAPNPDPERLCQMLPGLDETSRQTDALVQRNEARGTTADWMDMGTQVRMRSEELTTWAGDFRRQNNILARGSLRVGVQVLGWTEGAEEAWLDGPLVLRYPEGTDEAWLDGRCKELEHLLGEYVRVGISIFEP